MRIHSFTILTATLLSFLSPSHAAEIEFYKHDPRPYTHELPLNIVLFNEGPWSSKELKTNLEEAARIYAQCGVKLTVNDIKKAPGDGEVLFDLEGYTELDEAREEGSALDYGKKYSQKNNVTVFFMDRFDTFYSDIRATSVPLERAKQEDQKDALNTVWLSYQVESLRNLSRLEGGLPYGYSDLAHELGHIVLNASHVEENYIHNLMHSNFGNLNGHLTIKQCENIKSSPLLKKIAAPKDISCPEITSPLRGAINFLDNATPDCKGLASIINTLDMVKDSVSDLAPLGGVDFFMTDNSDVIQYSDKNNFEASLNITFDQLGMHPIRKEQSDILWIHELGHALLNAKLEEDWPWYKGRLEIMKEWGRLIREGLKVESEDTEISDQIMKQLSLLRSYPNNMEYEDILAPYHELFADAVVIIHTRDPRSLKMALDHPTSPDPQADLERDFSIHHPYETWEQDEAHSLLSPVRSHIWNLISKLDPNMRTNQEILRNLYTVIRDEVIERAENPQLWHLSVSEINLRLIKKLR